MRLRSPEQLAEIMRERGLSHRRLAGAIGLHHSFVDHLVSGRRSFCPRGRADAIVRSLDVSLGDLFEADKGGGKSEL